MQLEQLALGLAHLRKRQLGGFASARLRAGEDRPEADPHPRERHAGDVRLTLPRSVSRRSASGRVPWGSASA